MDRIVVVNGKIIIVLNTIRLNPMLDKNNICFIFWGICGIQKNIYYINEVKKIIKITNPKVKTYWANRFENAKNINY